MAVTGFWYARQASDDEVAALRPPIDQFIRRARSTPAVQELLEEWKQWPDRIHGLGADRQLDERNRRFGAAFLSAGPGEDGFLSCSLDDIDPFTWDVGREHPPEHIQALFCHVERFPPMSLLYVGIGPERAQWIPGAFGNFALTADELTQQADHIRRAHVMSPVDRTMAIERMNTWLEVVGGHGFNVTHLFEALPDLIGPALQAGKGLVSVTASL